MPPYVQPALKAKAFHCPHCGAYSQQSWINLSAYNGAGYTSLQDWAMARCVHCSKVSMWHDTTMLYPDASTAPMPNADLPDDIKADYLEARSILGRSPRGAAALMRLCVQKLVDQLVPGKDDLNTKIGALVKRGLLPQVQGALDVVRVIGNEAVHPGTLDLRDDAETAASLFDMVNLIAENQITYPKQVQQRVANLPQRPRDAIAHRDGVPPTPGPTTSPSPGGSS
jgi:hypothetical protein